MEEDENKETCATCDETPGGCAGYIAHADAPAESVAPVEASPVKPKQKRTSKTWLVTVKTDTEEIVMKVRNVLSAEAAMESARSVHGVVEVISAKPARTFK